MTEYKSIKQLDEDAALGYGNKAYDQTGMANGDSSAIERRSAEQVNTAGLARLGHDDERGRNGRGHDDDSMFGRGRGGYHALSPARPYREHETFEEEFKEEMVIERPGGSLSSSREML